LKETVTAGQAQAEVDALMDRVNATVTNRDGGRDLRINVVSVREDLVGGLARTLWILLAAVSGVLLIAATNVANLLLARAQQRRGEVAIRSALGGGRTRLFRQFLTESLALAAAGGLAGIAVAWAGMRALVAWAPPTMPRVEEVQLDPVVLGFAVGSTVVAALLFGVAPAFRATRTGVSAALGERRGTASRGEHTLSGILVVGEVALSLGLLMGTGLLLRSLDSLNRVDLGFEKEGILTFALETPDIGETNEQGRALIDDYLGRVEATPGVVSAGLTNRVPLGGGLFTGSYRSGDMIAAEDEGLEASYRFITPGYLESMGARFRAGRPLTGADPGDVALIDTQVAELLWPGQNALGKQIELDVLGGDTILAEVIGVVSPMKHAGVGKPAPATIFLSMLTRANQQNFRYMAVRVQGDPLRYVEPIRSSLKLVDGDAVMARIRPMSQLFDRSVASTRFVSLLLTVFGGVALMLATVGLHGLMALGVRQRSREFAIRVALGAEHKRILREVLGSGAKLVLLGAGVGVVLSLVFGRFLASLLYDIAPSDLSTMAVATSVLVAVGLLGAYMPARRVLSVDPVETLKED
jgi:predicted permease